MVNEPVKKPWARLFKIPGIQVDSKPVVVFPGCTAKNIRPQWTSKTNNLLGLFGYTVLDTSDFGCCGGTMHSAGLYDTMDSMQQNNVDVWKKLGRPRIAVFCASCHHALSQYGQPLLSEADTVAWRESLTPLSVLLADAQWEITDAKPESYGYHQPCHWGTDHDLPLLESGLSGLRKGEGQCCGMGGITQITNPDLSRQLADSCLAGFPKNTEYILTSCSGCTIQLAAAAPEGTTVYHWLDVVE
nr:(Fe-S)-binding protein [Pseudodesulfovibrio sp. JC047]